MIRLAKAASLALRCLQVASALMSACVPPGSCMARIMLFVGGPCTEGAGKVINRELSEEIRSHKDLAKDGAPHFRKAKKFYDGLGLELVTHGHIMDVFSCALDQVSNHIGARFGWKAHFWAEFLHEEDLGHCYTPIARDDPDPI